MTIRYTAVDNKAFGVSGIPSGYETDSNFHSELNIPSAGIKDIDEALFNLFDKEIKFEVSTSVNDKIQITKVPIVFAAAEKWALSKKNKAIRDKTGSIILPIITVVRTAVNQSFDDITSRGINQQTGELVISRKLDKSDRTYQKLLNKLFIKNQDDIAVSPLDASNGQISTNRSLGSMVNSLADDATASQGGVLQPDLRQNIYETITIPAPQFFTATYDVVLWAQYTMQMTQLLEQLMSSFLPQGNAWQLKTTKGYWYIATVDNNSYSSESNVDDMSSDERVIKYKFTINVPGYIVASKSPGIPPSIKRYISCPNVSFEIASSEETTFTANEPFLGSDDPTLPTSIEANKRRDSRDDKRTQLYPPIYEVSSEDPALKSFPRGTSRPKYETIEYVGAGGQIVKKHVRIASVNSITGETSYCNGVELGGITLNTVKK